MSHSLRLDTNLRRLVTVGCLVVAVDAAAKTAVRELPAVRRLPRVLPVQNAGYLLEIGKGNAPAVVSGLFLVVMAVWAVGATRRARIGPAAAGLLLGGAASNVLERAVRGAVTDFIATPWIVIDPADVAVLCGLAMILGARLRGRARGTSPASTQASVSTALPRRRRPRMSSMTRGV